MPLTCAICLSSSQRYGECTTIEAPRVVWMPQHLQKYTKIQRRQIIFFYSLLFVIHSCVIDYFCCQTYLYSFHSFSSSSSRNAMYVEIHFTVAAADGADVDAKWKTLCVRWRMIQLSAHTHMTHTHTQRPRCRRWNWYIQRISGNENVVCTNWFCTNRLALKAMHGSFFSLFGISILFIFHVCVVHSHVLYAARSVEPIVYRYSIHVYAVLYFCHTFCSLNLIRTYYGSRLRHRQSAIRKSEFLGSIAFSSNAESNFQWGNKTGMPMPSRKSAIKLFTKILFGMRKKAGVLPCFISFHPRKNDIIDVWMNDFWLPMISFEFVYSNWKWKRD